MGLMAILGLFVFEYENKHLVALGQCESIER